MTKKSLFLLVVLSLLLVAAPAHSQAALSGEKICLDPGHGGLPDPGAVNEAYGLLEKDINLDVAYGLKALLEGDDAAVVMTRTDDSYKSNSDRYTFCNNEQATILVSVHTNSVSDPDWDGSLALYSPKGDKDLAQAIHDVMYPYLRDTSPHPDPKADYFRDFGLDKFASGVLLKSNMPAAMMEPLFMSNLAEAELLVTSIYLDDGVTPNSDCNNCRRAQIAQAIYAGILSYSGASGDSPPNVSITNPVNGGTVSGTVTVTADASDDVGVSQIEFFVDAASIAVDADGSEGWSTTWDTTGVDDGSHTLTARATDSAGQTASDSISVTVSNTPSGGTSVTSIDPSTMSAGTTIDVTISGSGFVAGADVTFENGTGPAPTASGVVVSDDGTSITVTLTAKNAGPPTNRVWDVRVTNLDGSTGVLVGGFTVTP